MGTVQSSIRAAVGRKMLSSGFLGGTQVFRAYDIARSNRLILEMEMAARLSLGLLMTFEYCGAELPLFEGWALHALVESRILYMNNLNSCFRLLPRRTGPSNIWVACLGLRRRPSTLKSSLKNSLGMSDSLAPRDKPGGGEGTQSLSAWPYNVFREEMGCSSRALALEGG
ncbi:hypothetical protein EDB85DRAFT_617530 [Lactarius pseudohatsudake]|nr:hypothetical protein EDB85DRAFT_617530 [Lactarius pseudohatsudake]